MSSHSSHHHQDVLLTQFSLHVHKRGIKPHSFHFILQKHIWCSHSVSFMTCIYPFPANDIHPCNFSFKAPNYLSPAKKYFRPIKIYKYSLLPNWPTVNACKPIKGTCAGLYINTSRLYTKYLSSDHWTCAFVCLFNSTESIQSCSHFGALNLSYTLISLSYLQVLIYTSVKWSM